MNEQVLRVELKADEIDVINAALFIAAEELDAGSQARYGGGDNMRRVQSNFFDAVRAAEGEEKVRVTAP